MLNNHTSHIFRKLTPEEYAVQIKKLNFVGQVALILLAGTSYYYFFEPNFFSRFTDFMIPNPEDILTPAMMLLNPFFFLYSFIKMVVLFFHFIHRVFIYHIDYYTEVINIWLSLRKLNIIYFEYLKIKFFRGEFVLAVLDEANLHYKLQLFKYKYNIIEGAWYLRFGCLFLLTTLSSLIALSYLGLYGVFVLNLPPLFFFWISSIFFLKKVFFFHKAYIINFGKWFVFNISQKIFFELYIDYISLSFTVLTLTIALFVYIYCFSYFRAEPNVERLMLFINLFVISMVLLVSSGNFMVLFLGWELIGLTSFFLINFWSTRVATLKAAFKAFVFNKISDVSILITLLLLNIVFMDTSIPTLNSQMHLYVNYYIVIFGVDIPFIEFVSFFLITAAFIKSAQFGTHIWLPDSMEAPVPASALIHSATLVSAGVFLLLRFSPLFELSTYAFYIIPIIGSITAFFGGICAAYQSDIKRILAYSTISHCGFLMICFSTHICEYTLLYLYIHGFFKAAVFLCVGNVIRFSRNYQDFRRMGGFSKYLPTEMVCSLFCLINLSGLPFSLGFYIKHLLLLGLPNSINIFIFVNVIGGAISGIIYSYRLFYYVFFDVKKAKKAIYMQANRKGLRSYFYSNTTLASNMAIIALIFFSYVLSIYYFNICLKNVSDKSEIVHFNFVSANLAEYYYPTLSLLKNTSYINWLIIYVILLTYLVKWRYTYNYSYITTKFTFYLNWLIFTYMFYIILMY